MSQSIEFFVSNIEDGILKMLKAEMNYVKTFDTYSGELDSENFRKAIAALTPKFPLVLVSYSDGIDKEDPPTGKVFGSPLHFRHECGFTVICCSSDARGEKAQRKGITGTYKMCSDVYEILSGLRLKTEVENKEVILCSQLMPVGNEYIAKLPDLTAYAVHFDTYFRWSTRDRRKAGTPVTELIPNVDPLNPSGEPATNRPGVRFT